ncbi:MAG: hypothetical protein HYR56_22855 [Acidobacteria bacterium]|nr:hypothetical protein [Acidobacteriota bacterium]MBI3426468.1 hypothetical protein [Acidobacteriota bacterium]
MQYLKLFVFALCATFLSLLTLSSPPVASQTIEAPAGFDNQTNGLITQAAFEADLEDFAAREEIADGLGPIYNAQGCAECHQNPVVGGISQITELRVGWRDRQGSFINPPGGSLINDRAIHPSLQEYVTGARREMFARNDTVRTFRTSLNVLGDGFVEALDDNTLIEIARNQPQLSGGLIAGQVIRVPVLEAPGVTRVARFGWKNQHASLLSFSADAYLNEMGITTRLLPTENTSLGNSVAAFDTVADPEDTANEFEGFTRFMRATKAPPRDLMLAATPNALAGAQVFNQIGCAICHVPNLVTAPAGMAVNGGTFTLPAALGNKVFHPYSDFLLHDVGTGDGIVQNGDQSTANKLRTPPLWGVRTRTRLMHDGLALTYEEAIARHRNEARGVLTRYNALSNAQRTQLLSFLRSL